MQLFKELMHSPRVKRIAFEDVAFSNTGTVTFPAPVGVVAGENVAFLAQAMDYSAGANTEFLDITIADYGGHVCVQIQQDEVFKSDQLLLTPFHI